MKKFVNSKIFILAVTALYLSIVAILGWIIFDVGDHYQTMHASFSFIVINFFINLLFAEKSADFALTAIALFFTIIADRILVYNVISLMELAITFFTFTQIAYFFKNFLASNGKIRKIAFSIALPVVIIGGLITARFVMGKIDYLTIIALTYFTFLVISCIFAFTRFIKNPLFALGLLLFICCDIILGLDVIGVGGSVGEIVAEMNCWWFYFPSQALIIMSVIYLRFIKILRKDNEA